MYIIFIVQNMCIVNACGYIVHRTRTSMYIGYWALNKYYYYYYYIVNRDPHEIYKYILRLRLDFSFCTHVTSWGKHLFIDRSNRLIAHV